MIDGERYVPQLIAKKFVPAGVPGSVTEPRVSALAELKSELERKERESA